MRIPRTILAATWPIRPASSFSWSAWRPLAFALAALALHAGAARAGWPSETNVNLPLCTAPGAQSYRNAVSDGAGGLIVAWVDTRSDSADLYAQRVSANGTLMWEWNGTRVCGAWRDQDQPITAADGAGGCVVVWRDFRNGPEGDLYAQRLDASGSPLWTRNGVPVCTASGDQSNPVAVADGFGSTLIAWEDGRAGLLLYAQKLDAGGAARWTANGVALTPGSTPAQFEAAIAPDGEGGAIVGWSESSGSGLDVAMQHVSNLGNRLWGTSGVRPCTPAGDQFHLRLASDGALGVVAAWEDHRSGGGRVRAQRVDTWGALYWGTDGVEAGPGGGDQLDPALVADGAGGAVLGWEDLRNGNGDVWGQRLTASGLRAWGAAGLAVCAATRDQLFPALAADGTGGALFVWEDARGTSPIDVWVQRVAGGGQLRWAAGGTPVTTAPGSQYQPAVVSHDDSVGVVVWVDQRTGGSDLFAQRVPAVVTLGAPAEPRASALALDAAPNPARTASTLRFRLPAPGRVRLELLDPAGRRVRTLADEALPAGEHARAWDGRDDEGRELAAGAYVARLTVDGATVTRRVLRLGAR